jgi:hypothetical protein
MTTTTDGQSAGTRPGSDMTGSPSSFTAAAGEFLALRWLAREELSWRGAWRPARPVAGMGAMTPVSDADGVIEALAAQTKALEAATTGILLSGGIDSAILAALVPAGTLAYTIRFDAPGAIDESPQAAIYAARAGLRHEIVTVCWRDYERFAPTLMLRKRAPLHAVEVALYKAGSRALADGCRALVVGNGADSTFGGLDRLLSRDWRFAEFVARYTFVGPATVLADAGPVTPIFERYRHGDGIDVQGFLKVVHGQGVTQAFENAVHAAGCSMVAPYESLSLAGGLDLERVRRGESKYVLRDVFARLYPTLPPPPKIAFARPMDHWMAGWNGPRHPIFRSSIDVASLSGEQRWLVHTLDTFLHLVEGLHA